MNMDTNPYAGVLAEETAFFDEHSDDLLRKYPNRYLLIAGSSVQGDFGSHESALAEGIRRFDAKPYLVRRTGDKTPVLTAPALALGLLSCQR